MADSAPKITDRRSSRTGAPGGLIVPTSAQTSAAMRGRLPSEGVSMRSPVTSKRDGVGEDDVLTEMRRNRAVNGRVARLRRQATTVETGGGGSGFHGGADVQFATGRSRDPMFYWRQNNIPYDVSKDDELKKVRAFCRLLYLTHPIVSACVDIFSKFPLQGMTLTCKDSQLTDFHNNLFFDEEGLNYEEYLLDLGREYWLCGEVWPLGSWNAQLGVWDGDELLQPDDVEVERSPFLKDPRFLIRLPVTLRKVLQERSPRWEYDALMKNYPELAAYAGENALMPVSNILLKQLKFKGDTFHKRGLPILMRGFRAITQEEMLNSAMDAIADRLYTPLILAKLGASASDLGTEAPWIPTRGDLEDFEEALDAALSGDFRVLTHHFAIDMAPVFGRENMPDMSQDFDRLEDRILQVFGLSRTILQGADCLTGDTEINVRRAGKGFRMTIKEVAARFNGLDAHLPGRRWREDIPTYVSYAQDGVIRQGLLDAAWYSGVKEVFELTTESGRSVTASARHPFLTPSGEFVQLGDLRAGDLVQVNAGRRDGSSRKARNYYRQAKTQFHPYQSSDGASGKHKVPTHRLVMEAALNGLEYTEFLRIIRQDEIRTKELYFIDPQQFTVHHEDEDHRNNALANLALMPRGEHYAHHRQPEHVLEQVGSERIVSIISRGEQDTYDLGMATEPHNFLVNGFVVHNSGETYAADALNRDVVTQLLTHYQRMLKRFQRGRALIVAEAQEHFDYDVRNGKRYVIMEEILEVDEESGEEHIVEQPKLLVPDLEFDTMTLQDEQQERQFIEALNESGVPISYKRRLIGTGIDFDEEMEARTKEQVDLAVAEQETRRESFKALRDQGYPLPPDLVADFQPKAAQANPHLPMNQGSAGDQVIPALGQQPMDLPALNPNQEDLAADPDADQDPGMGQVLPMPGSAIPQAGATRPPESDEQRSGMPKPARKLVVANLPKNAILVGIREATDKHFEPVDNSEEDQARPEHFRPTGKFGDPSVTGMRRHVIIAKDAQASREESA